MDDEQDEVPRTGVPGDEARSNDDSPSSARDTNSIPGDGGNGESVHVTYHDLSTDSLLNNLPRVEVDGLQVPVLHGIRVVRKIGQGGMGAVYLGEKPLLRQFVAVKILPMQMAQLRPELVDRFVREAQLAASIDSPHLVRVSDVGEVSGQFFIVMEFVRGMSAGELLKALNRSEERMGEGIALDICNAATTGLVAAHTRGVIHRDVKPDNILIPRQGGDGAPRFDLAKLVDLGLARKESLDTSLTGSDVAMGTPGFMAPEQILAAHGAGKPADVYSMGATLFALLAGRAPFSGASSAAIMMKTLHDPPPTLREVRPDISAPTLAVIDRCLQKEADERFTDASALLEALRSCRDVLQRQSDEVEVLSRIETLRSAPEVGEHVRMSSIAPDGEVATAAPVSGVTGRRGPRSVLIAGLAAVVSLAIVGWIAVRWLRPSAPTTPVATSRPVAGVTLGMVSSPDRARLMQWATEAFSKTPRGREVKFDIQTIETQVATNDFIAGKDLPLLWSPTNDLECGLLEAHWSAAHSGEPFLREETVSLTPQVFIMYADRYRAFIKRYGSLGFASLGDAIRRRTWLAIGGPAEWGPFTFALSKRTESANGLVAAALAAYEIAGHDDALTRAEVQSGAVQKLLKELDAAFEVKGGGDEVMRDFVLKGPSAYDGVFTQENFAIQYLESAEDRWGKVVVVYPSVNMWNSSPICLMNTGRASDAQLAAANAFIDFLISDATQQELVRRGLRPADPMAKIREPGSPFVTMASHGIAREVPVTLTVSTDVVEALRGQ